MYKDIICRYRNMIENGEISDNVNTEADIKHVLDWINTLAGEIEQINNLMFDIVIKGNTVYLLTKFNGSETSICSGGVMVDKSILDSIETILSYIYKGTYVIEILNNKLDEIKISNGIMLDFKLGWGLGKCATVSYWDYTSIVLKLDRASMDKVCSLYDNIDSIAEVLNEYTWEDNITEFIRNVSKSRIGVALNINLDYSDIDKLLTSNMLSGRDILEVLSKNIGSVCTQKIKSVKIINQLGMFAAILIWSINYENYEIDIDIMDSKVLDLENGRFVSDHSLYSRIEQKIVEECKGIANEFKQMAS